MISENLEVNSRNKFTFSIVIPCRNEKTYIENCIKSILKQSYTTNLIEIIIVDGFSEDGTREIVNNLINKHSNIKLFDNIDRKTPQALNIGIKNSSGDIVVILGAHTEIDENFIYYNNKLQNDKNVKVTGGTQYNIGKNIVQKLIGLVMQIPFGMASAKYRWSNKEQFVDTVVYAAYRRELFDELGFFEENFTISEDAEFNWRVRQAGYKILYSPKIKSNYFPRESIFGFIKQIFRYGILRVNVVKKHFDSIKLTHLIPPTFVMVIILLTVLSLANILSLTWLLFLLIFYFVINIALTFPHIKEKTLFNFICVPLLILFMHLSWGSGFIIGLILPKSNNL